MERILFIDKFNALAARTATCFLNHGESDDRVTRHAMSDRQQDVCWLQVCALHDHSYIAGILLLAHGFTVKLSPCPCSHTSPAGRIAACLCGHPKCNLLLAQARPRMIQHLSSSQQYVPDSFPGSPCMPLHRYMLSIFTLLPGPAQLFCTASSGNLSWVGPGQICTHTLHSGNLVPRPHPA